MLAYTFSQLLLDYLIPECKIVYKVWKVQWSHFRIFKNGERGSLKAELVYCKSLKIIVNFKISNFQFSFYTFFFSI